MFKHYPSQDLALERIGQILAANVREDWVEIQADVELLPDDIVKTSHFYRPASNLSGETPLHIASGFEHMELGDCFQQLAKLTSTPAKGHFKKAVYRLLNTGKYTADYQY
jgi:hypothetical protein